MFQLKNSLIHGFYDEEPLMICLDSLGILNSVQWTPLDFFSIIQESHFVYSYIQPLWFRFFFLSIHNLLSVHTMLHTIPLRIVINTSQSVINNNMIYFDWLIIIHISKAKGVCLWINEYLQILSKSYTVVYHWHIYTNYNFWQLHDVVLLFIN